jgi:Eco57I restriction-modification methylase
MNTSALKTFAPAVRRQLMEAVMRKLDFVLTTQTPDYLTTYKSQVASLRRLAAEDRSGLVERVAYTWFNRLAALRYLDAKGWHPFRARVLTAATMEETQPELLKLMRAGALPEELRRHTDPSRLNDLLDGRIPSPDPQGEVYRQLVLAACRFYHALLPNLFERLDDETELLLPDDLLTEHSVAQGFRDEISDEDCSEVELLGWLYQFYISEKKDAVMARKSAVPSEDIPAVTQLFTPHWIVRYLVENSLGRLWLLNRPGSRLREKMPYYIEGEAETDFLKINRPEEIRLLDPAVGSGHMLTYAFDLLYAIYEEEGYAPSDIPALILTHNLHGVDICPRAAQLASLALVLKAREKSRRFFQSEKFVQPRILALQDVRFDEGDLHEYIRALNLGELFNRPVMELMRQFEQATTFGSLIQPCLGETDIISLRRAIEEKDLGSQLFLHETHGKIMRVLEQAEMLTQRYYVVVANPPYMGGANMNNSLKSYACDSYPVTKADLFSMFIEQGLRLVCERGYVACVTMQSWMFLSSFAEMRQKIVLNYNISNCIHIGYNSFPELNSKVAQAAAFIISKSPYCSRPGFFFNLNSGPQSADKDSVFLDALRLGSYYRVTNSQLRELPEAPIAYWVSDRVRHCFSSYPSLDSIAKPRQGATTSDNNRFLRFWTEVAVNSISFQSNSLPEAKASGAKWFPYIKGGPSRKWSGNRDYIVNYGNDGAEIKRFHDELNKTSPGGRLKNQDYYFRECISWSKVSSGQFAVRYFRSGFIFDVAGSAVFFSSHDESLYFAGLLNSVVVFSFLKAVSPTINFEAEHLACLPVIENFRDTTEWKPVVKVVTDAEFLSRADWDNFEISWDFHDLPLLRAKLTAGTLAASWQNWKAHCDSAIRRMQELETENNRLFIEAYGLQDELSPEVPEDQITLARADERKDMAAFLSYAVGCMMGRYSLDKPGLILAYAGDTLANYMAKVGKPLEQLRFAPDEDGIIPVLDGEWFEDDVVERAREFLWATYGKATLAENLRFIEEALGKDLRKYFLTDFYKNHISNERAYGYKKRPIYWLVQSPQKGFSALIYLHRYTRDTMNIVLNRYLRPYQEKLRNRLAILAQTQISGNTRDKTAARKEADKLTKILRECEEWERQTLLPLAQARIELDLDDGVKVNYQKLGEALAAIPGLASKDEE